MVTYNVLAYFLREEKFAVKRSNVVAIHPLTQAVTTDVEGLPKNIFGVIINGNVNVPVFSLHKELGLPSKRYDVNTKVIIIRVGQSLFGIIADQVPGIIKSSVKQSKQEQGSRIDSKFIHSFAYECNDPLPILKWSELFDFKTAIRAVN